MAKNGSKQLLHRWPASRRLMPYGVRLVRRMNSVNRTEPIPQVMQSQFKFSKHERIKYFIRFGFAVVMNIFTCSLNTHARELFVTIYAERTEYSVYANDVISLEEK